MMMISSFSPLVYLDWISKLCQNRTAGPLTGSIPILGGSSADKLSGPPPSRKVSSCVTWSSRSPITYSSGAWTKWNSSDDPWKEDLPNQGRDKPLAFPSFMVITRWLAIWTFQCLLQDLTPPSHLQQVELSLTHETWKLTYVFLL